jgi:hypothetical protein
MGESVAFLFSMTVFPNGFEFASRNSYFFDDKAVLGFQSDVATVTWMGFWSGFVWCMSPVVW